LDAAWGIARAQGWSWGDKRALIAATLGWQRAGFRCASSASVADLCRRIPAPVVQGLIEPLCISALNTPPERASGQVFLRVLRDSLFGEGWGPWGASWLLLPKAPLGELLPEPAARWLRSRGAVLRLGHRVALLAETGVPTTEQAIEFARQMGTPLVVAINKMDRPDAQKLLPKITQQLLARGVVPEDMGGEVPLVGVSATKRLHLDRLREAVLLQAELLELRAESQGPAEGVVLEATVQKGLGVVANVLVQRGALKPSDLVVVGTTWGKIKTLTPTDVRATFALPLSAAECHGVLLRATECR
jgi:hypothetical protein